MRKINHKLLLRKRKSVNLKDDTYLQFVEN
uniref:Uncharacterized protein n=1 Tax=Nelumbo nucifera TaxID=4432 RepID=A0A822YSG4_NELNU|nr:TPA_asm: hypothetical protein HUJ06_005151 [Nelumbo nucifera]